MLDGFAEKQDVAVGVGYFAADQTVGRFCYRMVDGQAGGIVVRVGVDFFQHDLRRIASDYGEERGGLWRTVAQVEPQGLGIKPNRACQIRRDEQGRGWAKLSFQNDACGSHPVKRGVERAVKVNRAAELLEDGDGVAKVGGIHGREVHAEIGGKADHCQRVDVSAAQIAMHAGGRCMVIFKEG